MPELRLLTYNVRSLRDDGDAVAAVIRACRPDVVAVQEAPRSWRWRSKRAALARRSGLVVATADRPAGLMVMTSLAVSVRGTSFALLPKTPDLHQRGVCVADLSLRGADWRVACLHLSMDAEERQCHLEPMWAAISPSAASGALVVAGDLNEPPGGPVWQSLTARLTDAWGAAHDDEAVTFSTRRPRMRIDAVFTDAEVVGCEVVRDLPSAETVRAASDHFPVLATLRA